MFVCEKCEGVGYHKPGCPDYPMTTTPPPEGTTEPPVECVAVDRDERCLCPGGPASHRPSPPAAEDDAVEKAARRLWELDPDSVGGFWDDHPDYPGGHEPTRRHFRSLARAALDAAGVSALRAEVERSERDWKQASEDADRWCARAEAAEAEVERMRAALDSTGLRERVAAAVDGVAVDHPAWGTAHTATRPFTDLGESNYRQFVEDITDAVLAVVGQGVTAEQAWDEGFADGKRHALEGDDGPRFVNPYRAVVRSGEQGGEE